MTDYLLRKKGKKQSGPAPDNLRSDDEMECTLGLCEGEIVGLYGGLKTLMLNGTPFQNADGTDNYKDAKVTLYTGQPSQGPIQPKLGGLARTRSVSVQMRDGVPVTRQTFGGTPVHYIDIRVAIQALYDTNAIDNGSIPCNIKIEWKWAHATKWYEKLVTVTGKTTSNVFVREIRIAVNTGTGEPELGIPIDLRVTLMPKAGDGVTQNVTWESFQEVQAVGPWSFNNTAVLHFWTPASGQIAGLPEISGIYKLMKVKIPSNYDPITRQYTGIWDGSWKIDWTNNPAYCLNDLVSNTRYGLNAYGPITLNKWDVYRAGKFCDRFVPRKYIGLDGEPHTFPPMKRTQAPILKPDYTKKIDVGYGWDDGGDNPELDQYGIQFSVDGELPALFYGETKMVAYEPTFTQTGTHTLYLFGDDQSVVNVDGVDVGSYRWGQNGHNGAWGVSQFNVTATGKKLLRLTCYNLGLSHDPAANPHFVAAKIVGPDGSVVWHSRMAMVTDTRCAEGWTYNPTSQLCEKVDDDPPMEPRFTFNGLIADPRLSMEQVRYLAGAFHGMLYDDLDGTIRLCVPDETPPVAIFNPDNVVDGVFEYSFTDLTTRYNDWTATFINPDLSWVEDRIRLVDAAHMAKYGRLPTDYIAVGCTNRSETIRRTEYRKDMALNQTMMVQFKINRQACYVRPGDRARIADPHMNGNMHARAMSVSSDGLTIDLADEVDFGSTDNWMFFQTPGGHSPAYPVHSRGKTKMLVLGRPLGAPPVVTIPSEDGWINQYGIALSDDGMKPAEFYGTSRTLEYTVNATEAGRYTVKAEADNKVEVYVDGALVVTGPLGDRQTATFDLAVGQHTITLVVSNLSLAAQDPPGTDDLEHNPHFVAVQVTAPNGSEFWSTRRASTLKVPDTFVRPVEPHFPMNIGPNLPDEKLWRIIGIDEDEGDPDHLLIHGIENWSFESFEPSKESGPADYDGGEVPTNTGVVAVPPPEEAEETPTPPALTGCPDFSIEWTPSGRQIKFTPHLDPSYHRYNGQYVVKSRPQASPGPWVERATVANAVTDHPSGAYEFKILPMNDEGVVADMDSTPTCYLSIPECPPVEVQGVPQNPTVSAAYDGSTSKWNYVVDWDDGGIYVKNYQVVVRDKDNGTPYRTQDVEDSAFIYTGAMQIQDSADDTGFDFEIRCRNFCDQVGNPVTVHGSEPPAADPTYGPGDPLLLNCGEIQKGKLAAYTEKVKEISGTGSITLDLDETNVWIVNVSGDVTISTRGGCTGPDCGRPVTLMLHNTSGGKKTVTYAMSPKWRDGENADITEAAGGYTMHLLFDLGNGVWLAGRGGKDFA